MDRGVVNDKNREFLLSEYVDNMVMNIHICDLESFAAEWLHLTYKERTNEQLQAAINDHYPHILDESLPCPYARK